VLRIADFQNRFLCRASGRSEVLKLPRPVPKEMLQIILTASKKQMVPLRSCEAWNFGFALISARFLIVFAGPRCPREGDGPAMLFLTLHVVRFQ
jgi:hypothetical protein